MLHLLRRLFFGYRHDNAPLKPAYRMQWIVVLRVWRNRTSDDYGIERLVRLALALFPFVTLGLFVRHVFARYGIQTRNIAIDTYVVLKVAFSLYVLTHIENPWWLVVPALLAVETIMHVFSLIFLSDQQTHPVLIRRTILLVLLNFLEVNVTFASIYKVLERMQPGSIGTGPDTSVAEPLSALYFSFITAGTIGYGDIYPVSHTARLLVLGQITLSFIFVVLFISFFTGRFSNLIHQQSSRRRKPNTKETQKGA